ncbi:MAG: DUF4878 domain-containing protein [Bdellovibrionales bacterium]|nr:DUF4878 domain-containing protein [Bdellovibrionales bacterium]
MRVAWYIKRLWVLSVLTLFMAASSWASPEERVQSMITQLSRTGSYSVLLEYIHWPSSFAAMPQQEKQRMGISSPEQLKQQVRVLMEHPENVYQQQFQEKMKAMTPDQRTVMQGYFQQQVAKMKTTLAEMKAKLQRTQYEIMGSSTEGDSATVTVKGVVDGRTKLRDIHLSRIDDEWYLPSLNGQGGSFGEGMFGG